MYTEYASPAADEPSRHVKSLAMGLLIRGIHQHILPPTCNSLPLWDPVLLAWGQSLYHLISVFYKLSQDVSQGWCNFFPQKISLDSSPSKSDQLPPPCFKFQCFKTYLAHTKPDDNHKTDPGKCLWQKVKKLCATIEEPKLNDFKPGAVKLLDVPTHLEFKCGCFWSS